jgi:hypothetical protein
MERPSRFRPPTPPAPPEPEQRHTPPQPETAQRMAHIEAHYSDGMSVTIDAPIEQAVSALKTIRELNGGLTPQECEALAEQLTGLTARLKQSNTMLQGVVNQGERNG